MKRIQVYVVWIICATVAVACNVNSNPVATSVGPHSWIDAPLNEVARPPNPCVAEAGSCIEIVSHSADPLHIVQVELSVNGQVVQTSPNADTAQTLVLTKQKWSPPGPGNYTLMLRAQNSAGVWGEYAQAIVTIGGAALDGIVQGVVYADLNGNGKIEGSEGALDGVTVSISGCGSGASQITGADGKFQFSNLPASHPPAGMCLVSVAKSGWVYSGSFPALGMYPVPAVSDPSKATAFSIFMTHAPGIVPVVIPTAAATSAPLPPVTIAFTADATTLTQGQCTTIHWQVTNASQVALDNAAVNPNGSKQDCPNQTTTHTLRVVALNGQIVQRTLTVTVIAASRISPATPTSTLPPPVGCNGTPVISSFSASPSSIPLGASSTLSWGAVTNADSVEIDNGIGGVAAPGSRIVSPSVTTVYVLTARCKGVTSIARTIVAVIQPPTPTLILRRLLPTPTRTPIIVR